MSSPNNDTDTDDLNGLILQSHYIPGEVVALILSFVDANSLAFRCRGVCKMWKYLIDEDVWKIKLRSGQEQSISKLSPAERVKLKLPWYVYYAVISSDPFEKNLIKNHCGQDNMRYWKINKERQRGQHHIDNSWEIETPRGSDPLPKHEDFGNYTSCFVTSYMPCVKFQIIKLKEHGISKKIMNEFQPTITASEWYAGRFDCGCEYQLTVRLLDQNKKVITEQSSPKMIVRQWEGHEWKKVELTFDNYGPGVRYIEFEHEGKDTQFWAGHYGSKMSGAVLKISLPKSSNPTSVLDVNFDSSSAQDDI